MKFAFIGGIPTAGKSYLANKLCRDRGFIHADVDRWRKEIGEDSDMRFWVDFFRNQDEEVYWQKTGCKEHWENLKKQSEALWPFFKENINKIIGEGRPTIFEAVNILPHLAAQDLSFQGIYLLGESFDVTFQRNKECPRWGKTEDLQKKESEVFYRCEGPFYKKEADKYGFKSFSSTEDAEKELLKILKLS